MADALVERAIRDDAGARWRFVEHRIAQPLLPPGTSWMQGSAGIAAFLFRMARVLDARPRRAGRRPPRPVVGGADRAHEIGGASALNPAAHAVRYSCVRVNNPCGRPVNCWD